jgi:predicted NAD/FAD-binding protein
LKGDRSLTAREGALLHSAVTGMRRRMTPKGPRIEMNVNGREEVFDRVILATPPWATVRYLDMTAEERDL